MIPWLKVQSTTTFLCRAVIFLSRQVRSISPRDTELARAILSHSPDVIHVHDAPQLQAGAIAASERKIPLIYDSHELWTGISALSKFQRGRIRRLEETTIPRCSAVITVNGHVAEEIQRRYRSKRPTVILNSVDTLTVPGKTDRLRQAFRISSNERIVLYQGWFSPERGIDLLLRAMCHTNSKTHLVLMGYGEYIEELMSIASKLGIADRVHHKHKVPQSELLEWTASADVGVIPYPDVDLNHRLCSPNKLFEFIQADLRVIGNDLPFLREVIVGDRIGLVAAIDNEAEFGSAIEQVAWCGGNEIQKYESALKSARDRYSWELQAELLLATYSAIHRLEGI